MDKSGKFARSLMPRALVVMAGRCPSIHVFLAVRCYDVDAGPVYAKASSGLPSSRQALARRQAGHDDSLTNQRLI